jgi:hypothetical protein
MHGDDHACVTAQLTAWSSVLKKLIVPQLVKIIPAFYGI